MSDIIDDMYDKDYPNAAGQADVGSTHGTRDGDNPEVGLPAPAAPTEKVQRNTGNDFCRTCGCNFPPDVEEQACIEWEKCRSVQAPQSETQAQGAAKVPEGMVLLPRRLPERLLEAMGAMDGYERREKEVFPYQRYQDYFDALCAAASPSSQGRRRRESIS